MKVAIQGVRGCFHEEAARKYFQNSGEPVEIVEKNNFEALLDSVVDFESDFGIIAIENTIAGTIHSNLNLIKQKDVKVCGEIYIRIKQNLAVLPGVKIQDLTEVRSHYMAINQTRKFFNQYPDIKLAESSDTAFAMSQVSNGQLETVGAVGSELAAELYGLEIIAPGIETNKKNYTRFLVVQRRNENGPKEYDKSSVNLVLSNEMGSLASILSIISYYRIDLTKIESLPIIGQPLNYMFYADLKFDDMMRYQNMLNAIRPLLKELYVLGEYQSGETSWSQIHKQ